MGELHPLNLPRIIEDARGVIAYIRMLGNPPIDEHDMRGSTFTLEEMRRGLFDESWEGLKVCQRRLNILLNDGDIDVLDCDPWTRLNLKHLWGLLEGWDGVEKPEFVEGGPQEFASFGLWLMMAEQTVDALARVDTRTERQSSKITSEADIIESAKQGVQLNIKKSRLRAPLCPKCNQQTKATTSPPGFQHWKCEHCGETGKQRRITDVTDGPL